MATHKPHTPISQYPHSQSDMDAAFEAACAHTGLAATDQRRLIYKVLAESREHPSIGKNRCAFLPR